MLFLEVLEMRHTCGGYIHQATFCLEPWPAAATPRPGLSSAGRCPCQRPSQHMQLNSQRLVCSLLLCLLVTACWGVGADAKHAAQLPATWRGPAVGILPPQEAADDSLVLSWVTQEPNVVAPAHAYRQQVQQLGGRAATINRKLLHARSQWPNMHGKQLPAAQPAAAVLISSIGSGSNTGSSNAGIGSSSSTSSSRWPWHGQQDVALPSYPSTILLPSWLPSLKQAGTSSSSSSSGSSRQLASSAAPAVGGQDAIPSPANSTDTARSVSALSPPNGLAPAAPGVDGSLPKTWDATVNRVVMVTLPVVAVTCFLALGSCCMHVIARTCNRRRSGAHSSSSQPGAPEDPNGIFTNDSIPGIGVPYVQPVGPGAALLAGSPGSGGGGPQIRSIQDLLQFWQRQLQRDGMLASSRSGSLGRRLSSQEFQSDRPGATPSPAGTNMARTRSGSGAAGANLTRANSSSGIMAQGGGWWAGIRWSMGERPASSPASSPPAAAAAATQGRYVHLLPSVADLCKTYVATCHAIDHRFDPVNPPSQTAAAGSPTHSSSPSPVQDRLSVLCLRLKWQLQHIQQQLQGQLLSTWQDVELSRDIWEAMEESSTSAAAVNSQFKRFPGLAPWLIADLPTWVNHPELHQHRQQQQQQFYHQQQAAPLVAEALQPDQQQHQDLAAAQPRRSPKVHGTGVPVQQLPHLSKHRCIEGVGSSGSMPTAAGKEHGRDSSSSSGHSASGSTSKEDALPDSDGILVIVDYRRPVQQQQQQNTTSNRHNSDKAALHQGLAPTGSGSDCDDQNGTTQQHLDDQWRHVALDVSPPDQDQASSSGGASSCTICLEPLAEGELLQQLPRCRHTFHGPCLAGWLSRRSLVLKAPAT